MTDEGEAQNGTGRTEVTFLGTCANLPYAGEDCSSFVINRRYMVDTGWYGTQGYDAAQAIEKLGDNVFIVHLKDVLEPDGHETCRFGRGCVPIEACVRVLKDRGYSGYYGVEHEPEEYDPTEDCKANLKMLQEWLAA